MASLKNQIVNQIMSKSLSQVSLLLSIGSLCPYVENLHFPVAGSMQCNILFSLNPNVSSLMHFLFCFVCHVRELISKCDFCFNVGLPVSQPVIGQFSKILKSHWLNEIIQR